MQVPLRLGGTKTPGAKAGGIGEVDGFRYAGGDGQTTRVWLVAISRMYAEALLGEVQHSKRELCKRWDIDIMRPEALLAEGERHWGRHFRARHASRKQVLGAGEGHPALMWAAMTRQARSLATKAPPVQRGGGAWSGGGARAQGGGPAGGGGTRMEVGTDEVQAARVAELGREIATVRVEQGRLDARTGALEAGQERLNRWASAVDSRLSVEEVDRAAMVRAVTDVFGENLRFQRGANKR